MKRRRHAARPVRQGAVEPFRSTEEAWFWFIRCQRARLEGARFEGVSATVRPCDPDDVYRAIMALVRRGALRLAHLRVLLDYGFRDRPPDGRVAGETKAARLWDEGLDRLTTVLKGKGIVE